MLTTPRNFHLLPIKEITISSPSPSPVKVAEKTRNTTNSSVTYSKSQRVNNLSRDQLKVLSSEISIEKNKNKINTYINIQAETTTVIEGTSSRVHYGGNVTLKANTERLGKSRSPDSYTENRIKNFRGREKNKENLEVIKEKKENEENKLLQHLIGSYKSEEKILLPLPYNGKNLSEKGRIDLFKCYKLRKYCRTVFFLHPEAKEKVKKENEAGKEEITVDKGKEGEKETTQTKKKLLAKKTVVNSNLEERPEEKIKNEEEEEKKLKSKFKENENNDPVKRKINDNRALESKKQLKEIEISEPQDYNENDKDIFTFKNKDDKDGSRKLEESKIDETKEKAKENEESEKKDKAVHKKIIPKKSIITNPNETQISEYKEDKEGEQKLKEIAKVEPLKNKVKKVINFVPSGNDILVDCDENSFFQSENKKNENEKNFEPQSFNNKEDKKNADEVNNKKEKNALEKKSEIPVPTVEKHEITFNQRPSVRKSKLFVQPELNKDLVTLNDKLLKNENLPKKEDKKTVVNEASNYINTLPSDETRFATDPKIFTTSESRNNYSTEQNQFKQTNSSTNIYSINPLTNTLSKEFDSNFFEKIKQKREELEKTYNKKPDFGLLSLNSKKSENEEKKFNFLNLSELSSLSNRVAPKYSEVVLNYQIGAFHNSSKPGAKNLNTKVLKKEGKPSEAFCKKVLFVENNENPYGLNGSRNRSSLNPLSGSVNSAFNFKHF